MHRCREAIAAARAQLATETKAFITPGPRMVDEIECVLSVLLAIILAHLIGAQNISWAAFSGYLVMRGHVYDSLRRGILRIVGTSTGAAIAFVTFPIALSPIALSAAVLLIGWCSLYAALTHRHAYAFVFIGLMLVMIVLGYPQSPSALLALAFTRILEVFAGTSACVVISVVSTLTVRRQWPAQRQPTNGCGGANPPWCKTLFGECGRSYVTHDYHVDYMVNMKYCFSHVSGAVVWT